MKNFTYGTILLVGLHMAGCGGSGGGGGDSTPGPQNENADDALQLDESSLKSLAQGVARQTGSDPLWNLRAVANGKELLVVTGKTYTEMATSVALLRFKRGDTLHLEMSLVDASDSKLALATNLEDVAAQSADSKKVWDDQCKGRVSPDVVLTDSDQVMLTEDHKARIKLQICDLVGVTLKPIVVIAPQPQLLEKKTVIYDCAVSPNSTGSTRFYRYENTPCTYGYATEVGETAPVITILKKFAPGTPDYLSSGLVLDTFELDRGRTGEVYLNTEFFKPPFGSHEGCHTQKLDVKYGSPDGIKTARLVFKRGTNSSGQVVWLPQNSQSWPSLESIVSYYSNARDEKIHVYRMCEWIPELLDNQSGQVVTFGVQ